MGHKFLKHIERTRLLVMVVDFFGFRLSPSHPHRSNIENIFALNKELEMYDESLFEKPCILLLNKMDLNTNKAEVTELVAKANNLIGMWMAVVRDLYNQPKKNFFFRLFEC